MGPDNERAPGNEAHMKKTKYPGVHKRPDGRYQIRVKGISPKTGKMRNLTRVITVPSAAAANQAREALRQRLLQGETEERKARLRVEDAATSWLRMKLPALKTSTRERYATSLDHVIEAIGDIYLDRLTSSDIVRFRDSGKAAPPTINSWLRILKSMLADVCHEAGIPNPAARVSALREHKRPASEKALSGEELALLLETTKEHEPDWYPLFATLAFSGMRLGEVTALEWPDVEFANRVIRIRRARYKQEADTTKTGSVRSVPISGLLVEVLRDHRRTLLATQSKGLASNLVFPSRTGGYVWNSSIRDALIRVKEVAQLERRFTPHGFRYTFNSLMRQTAADHIVRSMTGHTTEAMTEHYSHVSTSEKAEAMEAFVRLVSPAPEVSEEVSVAEAP